LNYDDRIDLYNRVVVKWLLNGDGNGDDGNGDVADDLFTWTNTHIFKSLNSTSVLSLFASYRKACNNMYNVIQMYKSFDHVDNDFVDYLISLITAATTTTTTTTTTDARIHELLVNNLTNKLVFPTCSLPSLTSPNNMTINASLLSRDDVPLPEKNAIAVSLFKDYGYVGGSASGGASDSASGSASGSHSYSYCVDVVAECLDYWHGVDVDCYDLVRLVEVYYKEKVKEKVKEKEMDEDDEEDDVFRDFRIDFLYKIRGSNGSNGSNSSNSSNHNIVNINYVIKFLTTIHNRNTKMFNAYTKHFNDGDMGIIIAIAKNGALFDTIRRVIGDDRMWLIFRYFGKLYTTDSGIDSGTDSGTDNALHIIETILNHYTSHYAPFKRPPEGGYGTGEILFYKPHESEQAVKVKCMKVHKDNYPDLYYTVILLDDDSCTEKQTVPKRLSRFDDNHSRVINKLVDIVSDVLIHTPKMASELTTSISLTTASILSVILSKYNAELLYNDALLGRGIGTISYDVITFLKNIRDSNHFMSLSVIHEDVISGITTQSYRDFVPSVIDCIINSTTTNDHHYKLLFIAKHSRHIPINKYASISKYINTALNNISNYDTASQALAAYNSLSLNLSGESQLVINSFCNDVPNMSLLVDLFLAAKNNDAFIKEFLSFLLLPEAPKHPSLIDACKRNLQSISSILDSAGDDLATSVTAYQLLSLVAKSPSPTSPPKGAELDTIAENVRAIYETTHLLEEREQIEDDVAMACTAIPKVLRMRLETQARIVSCSAEEHERAVATAVASGVERSSLSVVGKSLRFLAVLDFIESACTSKDGKSDGWRGNMGTYMSATGVVDELMEFFCSCIETEDDVKKEKKKAVSSGGEDGRPKWMNVFEDFSSENREKQQQVDSQQEDSQHLDAATEKFVGSLCSFLFFRALQTLPSVVKAWWGDTCQDRAIKTTALAFVEARAGKMLLKKELDTIEAVDAGVMGDMEVKGNLAGGSIVASYLQDETVLRVIVNVPSAFPLKNVEVDCSEAGGGGGTLAVGRKWGLMMNCLIKNQDGGIVDALLMWKKNIDHEFEGVEPCPICYCVLEPKTRSMPTLKCKTCSSTSFHNPCLVKWFQQSGKTVCVVCQQDWKGGYKK
jgi:hypothetical protein